MLIPRVSLIMAVFNGEEYLSETLDSILAQSMSEFECIIVDDASSDRTPIILGRYAALDKRIRILSNNTNRERSFSRNRAIQNAKGQLIAVADADDWLHPDRLLRQCAYMEEHPEVTVCGGWIEKYETHMLWQWPVSDPEIRAHILFNSPIAHPTAMFRKSMILSVGGYDATYPPVEDYDLWARLAEQENIVFANIPVVLLRYRLHSHKDRTAYHEKQRKLADIVRLRLLRRLGLEPDATEFRAHSILARTQAPQSMADLYAVKTWANKLERANALKKFCEQKTLSKELIRLQRGLYRRMLRYYGHRYAPTWFKTLYRRAKAFLENTCQISR